MPTYKNEKANTWYCKFYYTDWNGKKIQKKKSGFKLKRDAQEWENNFLSAHEKTCANMDMSAVIDLYMQDCKVKLKPTTYYDKQIIIVKHIVPYFGQMKISEITANDIRLYHNALIDGTQYKNTYLRKINAQLSGIFNFAVKYYGLKQNPVALCENIGKGKADVMQFWTASEFKTFAEFFADDTELYTAFHLLFYTGIRLGEFLALTWKDIDFKGQTLDINKNIGYVNGKEVLLTPKTQKSIRHVAMPAFLCSMLEEYKKQVYDNSPDTRVFNKSKYSLRRALTKGCEQTGVKKIRLHDFRHSHASLLIECGFSPLAIADRLGHENIQTTLNIYGHLYPNKQDEIVAKLEKIKNDSTFSVPQE